MEPKNIKEKEMPLLDRKRISFELENTGKATPSKKEIIEEISKKYDAKPELISVRHVYTNFGSAKTKVIVHIYKDAKLLKFLETPKGKKEKKPKEQGAK